jgi:hypothetical protein
MRGNQCNLNWIALQRIDQFVGPRGTYVELVNISVTDLFRVSATYLAHTLTKSSKKEIHKIVCRSIRTSFTRHNFPVHSSIEEVAIQGQISFSRFELNLSRSWPAAVPGIAIGLGRDHSLGLFLHQERSIFGSTGSVAPGALRARIRNQGCARLDASWIVPRMDLRLFDRHADHDHSSRSEDAAKKACAPGRSIAARRSGVNSDPLPSSDASPDADMRQGGA